MPSWSERRSRELQWCRDNLPDEHTGFCAVALIALEVAGVKRSVKSVMARLEAAGRTRAQLEEKGWL